MHLEKEDDILNILAIDIGGTAIKMAISNKQGVLKEYNEFPSEGHKGGEYLVKKIMNQIDALSAEFDGIGISTAGQVDSVKGEIIYANDNIRQYTGMKLKKIFEDKYQVPVHVENDVNAAALGESYFGKDHITKDFLFITYGTGIGGAIFTDSGIYKGHDGIAGEFGHITLYPKGRDCACGRKGCYEQYASTTALVNDAKQISLAYENGRKIFHNLRKDDILYDVVQNWMKDISYGITTLIHIFNPSKVILGGGIMEQSEIISKVNTNVREGLMDSFSTVEIVGSSLGNKAGLLGATTLHLK